jgi:serine/threonine protein kinase
VALKTVEDRAQLAAAERLRGRALPGVARVLDVGDDWIATELLEGGTLRTTRVTDPLGVVRQLLEGLAALHELGLVHGDVKPENVVLDALGQPKLIDVGARAPRSDGVATSWTDAPTGSTGYSPPEKLDGAPPHPADDVFAVGVILFELVTGSRPCGPELPPLHARLYEALCARRERRPTAVEALRLAGVTAPTVLPPELRVVAVVAPGVSVRLRLAGRDLSLPVEVDREHAALLVPERGVLRVAGPAPRRAVERLLELLPEVTLTVVSPSAATDDRGELFRLMLARDVHLFDRVRARRHGAAMIYWQHDPTASARDAALLRDAFKAGTSTSPLFELARAPTPPLHGVPGIALGTDDAPDPATLAP